MNLIEVFRRWLSSGKAANCSSSVNLSVLYWSGGVSRPRRIVSITEEEAYIETDTTWGPGTVMELRIQQESPETKHNLPGSPPAFLVEGIVLRCDSNGLAVGFMFHSPRQRKAFKEFLMMARNQVHSAPNGGNGFRRAQEGHSLIEFALLIPLLFLLIVNVVNFGAFFYAWITVANAARAGAQYRIMGGATINSPQSPTAAQVYNIVSTDMSSLRNSSSLAVRVCTKTGSTTACNTSGSGSFTNPPDDTRAEASFFVTAWVDVLYTYEPLIPAFHFPGMGIRATLPPTQVHRKAVMRMLQ